ncbi:sensor histidine kinase [Actinospongicola halichondriae]|uniref:sensor histidine kinase n=1 Tax=Actinospongicola halichondriae TaxID=3236844 RepID=UPI003D506FC9
MSRQNAIALAAAIPTAVWIVTLLLWWRSRRRIGVQAHAAAARLATTPISEAQGLEATIGQLERAVDEAVTKESEASDSETRLAHAISAINDGVVLFDDAGTIVFRNQPAAHFLDARHGEAIVESAIEELATIALDGQRNTQTLELFGPPRRTLVITAEPLDDGHRSIGALVVIDDVTERQRIDAVRRDFVANISHELKTPVGGIGVLAETLLGEDDLDIIGRLANRMHHEAMRASRTIDDLLELSRIEAGEASLRDPVAVHLVLAEAVERASTAAEQAGITLDLVEPSHRLEVLGDRRQLVSALFNLLDNAIKYSAAGSSVVVSAATDGPSVRMSVADRGIGIPRRDLERIFERFYRVDRARSRDTGGTGLGLAIVRHVAFNHGGEVTVDSREGEGTTFTLVMPAGAGPVAVTTSQAG